MLSSPNPFMQKNLNQQLSSTSVERHNIHKETQAGLNKNPPDYLRSGSRDNVRKIVEKEGKTARNLIVWSVPSENDEKSNTKRRGRKSKRDRWYENNTQLQRGRPKSKKRTGNSIPGKIKKQEGVIKSDVKVETSIQKEKNGESKENRESKSEEYKERIREAIEKSFEGDNPGQRPMSAASPQSQKSLRARYWSYLFDNFHRAVDEIYGTCENDESIIECKEVIMMLDVCKRDFQGLIHRLELFNQLETSKIKPQSLAWEVRKQMSPGKCPSPTMRRSPSPAAVKFLNFANSKPGNFSWADRVRGVGKGALENNIKEVPVQTATDEKQKTSFPSPVFEHTKEEVIDDNDGWEIVTKGRSRSKASSQSASSTSSQGFLKNFNKNALKSENKDLCRKELNNNYDTKNHATVKQNVELNTTKSSSKTSSTSTLLEYEKLDIPQEDVSKSHDSLADATLDFSYDFTEDEIQIQIKEEQEKALASAIAEEETLTKELEQEALKDDEQDDDISSDQDYTNTDEGRETPRDLSEELPLDSSFDEPDRMLSWEEMCSQYDKEHESGIGFNWGEMMEITESVRMPGRALEMHQKLSSPSRKKSRSESVKRSEEKMARAERRRLRLLVEKCQRLRDLSERVQNVRELKNKLIQDKERTMLDQMRRAELNRRIVLQEKIKKAQEEELKVNEIAFINSLEAQNKKIEVQEKHQVSEARLQDLLEERQRRKEDKHAKEEAVQERRNALEQERLARLQEIKQKRGDQAAKWMKERIEREKERDELAKERQKNRKMRAAAREEAIQQAAEELQKRIEQKHIESTRRHEQRIEEVKEKSRAASSSRHATVEDTPSSVPYDKLKKCTLCDIEIASDVYLVSHLKGNKHRNAVKEVNKKITEAEMDAFSSKYIKEAELNNTKKLKEQIERAKAMKKRAKKIKARMASKGKEYEANILSNMVESPKKGKFQKSIKEINKVLQSHSNGPWPSNKVASLDKALSEICRSLEGHTTNDQRLFCQLGGLSVVSRVLLLWDTSHVDKNKKNLIVPSKIIKHAVEVIQLACTGCTENSSYFLLSNKLGILVDLLAFRLLPVEECKSHENKEEDTIDECEKSVTGMEVVKTQLQMLEQDDKLTIVIMNTISMILQRFYPKWPQQKEKNDTSQECSQRVLDIVSYVVCNNIVEKLINIYYHLQGPLEDLSLSSTLQSILQFYQPLVTCVARLDLVFTEKKEDLSSISQTMKTSEAFGLVALMYSLLHQGSSTRISPSPLPLADSTMLTLVSALKALNALALMDLHVFQSTVVSEGTSLQYRSVVTYLLRYTSNEKCDDLLHEVILSIGYFTLLNNENQMFIQFGRAPSLIQQLCTLPFGYFSDPKLKCILFPTLISCCFNNNENKKIVALDVNPTLLALYIEEKMKEKSKPIESMDQHTSLDLRFPRSMWDEARNYFNEVES